MNDTPRNGQAQDRLRILLVEDDTFTRRFLAAQLDMMGYASIQTGAGEDALGVIEEGEADLVLLDLGLPDMNGEEVLGAIRSDERHRHLPVIIITAAEDRERRIRLLESGANDYLHKPVDTIELGARVRAHLAARQATQLASLLEVAGAVAHEMNQPLTGLVGYADLLQKHGLDNENAASWVGRIGECSQRLSAIVDRLARLRTYRTVEYVGQSRILDLGDAGEGDAENDTASETPD